MMSNDVWWYIVLSILGVGFIFMPPVTWYYTIMGAGNAIFMLVLAWREYVKNWWTEHENES